MTMQTIRAAVGMVLIAAVASVSVIAQPKSATRVDELLKSRVAARIARAPDLRHDSISVTVMDRVVRLTGSVDSPYKKPYAARLARIKGVIKIENRLDITRTPGVVVPNTRGAITPPPIK